MITELSMRTMLTTRAGHLEQNNRLPVHVTNKQRLSVKVLQNRAGNIKAHLKDTFSRCK